MTRTAVVTGAASGMGRSIADELARRGHKVALLDRQGPAVKAAADELAADGFDVVGHEVDVSDRESVRRTLDAVREQLGPITIMVTSAGVSGFVDAVAIDDDLWDQTLAINLTGTFVCLQAVIPDMLAAGWGRMVTISSQSAQSGSKRQAHYVASKGGVIALTKALAAELSPHGITVNTIPPSIVDTPMAEQFTASGDFPGLAAVAAITPVRRVATGHDIAAACAFLCSEDAGFITGQQIGVNGGLYM